MEEKTIRQVAYEHREGRIAALERVAFLENRLQEIGDLAASSRTGPGQIESLRIIEELCDVTPNVPHNRQADGGTPLDCPR